MEEEEIMLSLVSDEGIPGGMPLEFYLSDLLDLNFGYCRNKEETVKDLNVLIQAIEKYRDSL